MQLHQIVKINEAGLVANAVSFELMDDSDKNLRLCQGFVFNYDPDPKQIKTSTIGVLDAVRRSFHSPSEPNVHLMVQDYGKGKSHFALAIANFFQKPYDSDEVQGVLKQVEYATNAGSLLESLRAYKQRGRHLVICLSGDKPIDLRKHFLQTLRKILDQEGVTDAIAQRICQRPLQYLERLKSDQRAIAESYLKDIGNPEGDVASLMQLLKDDNYQIIPQVKAIFHELVGDYPDWEADVDVEAILNDLVTRLCTGADARYQGILILFDELYNYLQLWASDPVRAGSTTLQNITNTCERFTGKIALIGFAQRKLSRVIPAKNIEDYKRLVTRLELLSSTYEPAASLELVLDGLLNQQKQTAAWQDFHAKWNTTLHAESRNAFEKRTANYYSSRNWTLPQYCDRIGLGCFPLHPLTAYLLCNLDFTQGRTAIQFVQDEVKRFITEEPVEKNGILNYVYPVALVDAFEGNFSNPQVNPEYPALFTNYSLAANKVKTSADADPSELALLKALFLFHASGTKLAKPDRERHEEILSLLAGLTPPKTKSILEKLWKVREVIHHNPSSNTYDFYSNGIDPDALRRRIGEETANQTTSLNRVETFCRANLNSLVGSHTVPTLFVEDNRLRYEDWRFQNKVFTIAKFPHDLFSDQTLRSLDGAGLVAYVMAETHEEILALRNEIESLLAKSPIKGQIVVAIAVQPAENLARLLLELEYVEKKSVQEFGAALTQLRDQYKKQINDSAADLFKSCIYFCHIQDKIPTGDRTEPTKMISAVLSDRFPYIPPIEKMDRLALKSTTGSQVIGYAAKRLLEDDLRPSAFPQKNYATTIDPVFVATWGLLRKSNQKYTVTTPTHSRVLKAWGEISEMMTLGEQAEKAVEIKKIWQKLSSPPYGYNEYTFTILFVAWLAHHRAELWLKGGFGIPQGKLSVSVKEEPIVIWVSTNILDKPKEFVNEWIIKGQPKLIRRKPAAEPEVPPQVDYGQAQQLIQQIDQFLASGTHDTAKVSLYRQKRDLLQAGCDRLDELLEPAAEAEALLKTSLSSQPDIEPFIRLCRELQNPIPIITDNDQSVAPTEPQRKHQEQALQALVEHIGHTIEIESERYQQLRTEADCGAYKANIRQLLTQVRQIADLPSRHLDALQTALQASDIKQAEIIEQRKVEDCLTQIKGLYNTLSNNATQDEYHRVQAEIEKLVEGVPGAKNADPYRETINALSIKQDELILQIAQWEDQCSSTQLKEQADQLKDKIIRQYDRFTESDSRQRLDKLRNNLQKIIFGEEEKEKDEKILQKILEEAEGKLKNATTLRNLSDAFLAYQSLVQLTLPVVTTPAAQADQQRNLDTLKREGHKVIVGKLTQLVEACNRKLNQKQEYDQLRPLLQKSQSLVATDEEFSAVRDSLAEAEKSLESQYQDLQRRLQDSRTIQLIRQYTLAKATTVHLCEESIKDIETARDDLRDPAPFAAEIDRLFNGFKEKVMDYSKSLQGLRDRLSTVDHYYQLNAIRTDYAKLEHVFKDSSEYPTYLQIQEQIYLLETDLEQLQKWEILHQQSQSIAACDDALVVIGNEQTNLHDLERFRSRLLNLETELRGKKQNCLDQLEQFQNRALSLETLKEAHKLQRELAEKSVHYRNSQLQDRHEAIAAEVGLLVSLFQIADAQKTDTAQACQAEIDRLHQWLNTTEGITPTIQSRLEHLIRKLGQTQQTHKVKRLRAAAAWLRGLEEQETNLNQLTDATKKLEAAGSLLKLIRKQRNSHEDILEEPQKQTLESILRACSEIQRQTKESQIITLFQELTHEQRGNLHRKLADYLVTTTEEFHDG
jgi:hypothetical protein